MAGVWSVDDREGGSELPAAPPPDCSAPVAQPAGARVRDRRIRRAVLPPSKGPHRRTTSRRPMRRSAPAGDLGVCVSVHGRFIGVSPRVFHRLLGTILWKIDAAIRSRNFRAWSRNSDAVSSCVRRRSRVRSLLQRPGDRTQPGKGGDFGNETRTPGTGTELRLRTGVRSPSGRRIGPTVARRTGTLGPLRRDGGPLGTSAGNGGRSPRGRGPRLRPRDPAAGSLRRVGGDRDGRKTGSEP